MGESQSMLVEDPAGLYCPAGDFYIDPWGPVPRAVITHAHGDHARPGSAAYLCATACAPLLRRRVGPDVPIESVMYGDGLTLGTTRVSLHPAGHILGSAQVRIEGPDGVWVVTGDYKRAADPTCEALDIVPCDTLVTESTFGLPVYHWDAASLVIADLLAWWHDNRERGLASIVFCYALGKAQRLLAELARVIDEPVLAHGMMLPAIEIYREAGIVMLDAQPLVDRRRGQSLAGSLILAPLAARGTPWMRRLGEFSDAFVSGLMRVRGVRRQRAYDRGFVLSDHADWPALLDTIAESGASRVIATHGHAEPFARYLREQGLDAGVMRTAWEGEIGADIDAASTGSSASPDTSADKPDDPA
jgi:putative mRNA 3-end processing factor